MNSETGNSKPSILHVCAREMIKPLRDQILMRQGYEVVSTLSVTDAFEMALVRTFSLVLIDVEGSNRVPLAEKLCSDIKHAQPDQKVAFIYNYRVAIESNCPDELIRAEFNPEEMVRGVKEMLNS